MNIPQPQLLQPHDSAYPAQLQPIFGGLASPDIWYLGNLDLLKAKGVGFCGSRNASEPGLMIAADCATQLSERGIAVISGYAPGVDMASHEAALAHGGNTVIVLPEGINHFRIKKTIKALWDWNRVLVISYFPKEAVWRPDRAMDRNRVIVALSDAVLVLEARDRGGTLNAGYCALQMSKPLFVVCFDDMADGREGNQQLLHQGGIPLRRSRTSGHAELRRIFEILNTPDGVPPARKLSA
jgi:DNA processing protein